MNKYMLLLATCIATQAVRADVDVTMTDASGEQTVVHLAPEQSGSWMVGTTEVCLRNVEETEKEVSLVIFAQKDEANKTEEVAQEEENRTVDVEIQEAAVAYGEKVAVLDVTISVEQTEAQTAQN